MTEGKFSIRFRGKTVRVERSRYGDSGITIQCVCDGESLTIVKADDGGCSAVLIGSLVSGITITTADWNDDEGDTEFCRERDGFWLALAYKLGFNIPVVSVEPWVRRVFDVRQILR